jgi:hypothetical protein
MGHAKKERVLARPTSQSLGRSHQIRIQFGVGLPPLALPMSGTLSLAGLPQLADQARLFVLSK